MVDANVSRQHRTHRRLAAGCRQVARSETAKTLLVLLPSFDVCQFTVILRCRCAVELHAIALKKAEGPGSGGRFAIAMLEQERERFIDGIRRDTSAYVTSSFCIATTFLLLILFR